MKLQKRHNHDHFWVRDHTLYESYNTIRGMRFMAVMEVPSEDNDCLSEEDIKYIEENYLHTNENN